MVRIDKSKPIIDIAVVVTDFDRIMSYNEQLQQEGIFYRGSDVEHQLLYVMGDIEKDTRPYIQDVICTCIIDVLRYKLCKVNALIYRR